MPLPLAMMIPFMGIQSAVMAKQFGENFQYGKRRISAMSNDEFNKLTPKLLQDNANAELKAMIPSMQDSITDMRHFQEFMIKEMLFVIGDMLRNGLGFLLGVTGDDVNKALQDIEHFIHGHGGLAGHEPATVEPVPTVPIESPTSPTVPPAEQEPPTETILTPEFTLLSLLNNAQGMVQFVDGKYKIFSRISGNWTLLQTASQLTTALFNAGASWPPISYKRFTNTEFGDKRWFWVINNKVSSLS